MNFINGMVFVTELQSVYSEVRTEILCFPVAARSKARACSRSFPGIVGLNPTGGMDIFVLCVV